MGLKPKLLCMVEKTSKIWWSQPSQPCPLIPYTHDTLNLSPSPGHTRSFHEIICQYMCSVPLPNISSILPTLSWKTSRRPSKPITMLPYPWSFFDFPRQKSVFLPLGSQTTLCPTAQWAQQWWQGLQLLQGPSALCGAPETLSKDFPHECHQPFCSKHSIKFQMAVPYHDGWFKKDRKAKT